jgi:hypothetical protein
VFIVLCVHNIPTLNKIYFTFNFPLSNTYTHKYTDKINRSILIVLRKYL